MRPGRTRTGGSRRWWAVGAATLALLIVGVIVQNVCLTAYFRYDIALSRCPDGRVRQTVNFSSSSLRRKGPGHVSVSALAHYTIAAADESRSQSFTSFQPKLSLVDAAGKETPLSPKERWQKSSYEHSAQIELPDVADGDYQLRARISSRIGDDQVDVALPLYTPARIHVLTDRPLYEPGHTVRFRATVLRARDLVPLDGRPGLWRVTDPEGEVVLEEKAPAGEWGVVAGSFPLDKGAAVGSWKVAWVSGGTTDEVSFTVKPFTLPRFRVELDADRPFYGPGDEPVVRGSVTYSSGAPVAGAKVSLRWSSQGEWPPPTGWLTERLPKTAATEPNGRFELKLPAIPADLQDQVTLRAAVAAVDPAGDRVEGSLALLLSQEALQVSSVTELGDGLVDGFNNRLYVRVTTADGRPLAGSTVKIRRAWTPDDPGTTTVLDEDSVGSLQVDPGPAVNVVLPARPVRRPQRPAPVRKGAATELIAQAEPPLGDQLALDGWLTALQVCSRNVETDNEEVLLSLRVAATGAVIDGTSAARRGVDACALEVARKSRLPAGRDRLYQVRFYFSNPELPRLAAQVSATHAMPKGLEERLAEAARGARDCLGAVPPAGTRVRHEPARALPRLALWRVTTKKSEVQLTWVPEARPGAPLGAMPCIEARLSRVLLDEPADADRMGLLRLRLVPPEAEDEARAQSGTMLGYEFLVTLAARPALLAKTSHALLAAKLRMKPGQVPPLRLRATPVIATAKDEIKVEMIRGPSYSGALPRELYVKHLRGDKKIELEKDTRSTQVKLEPGTAGFVEIHAGGARALVYVKPDTDLSVSVSPDQERYAPGQTAKLKVKTTVASRGGQAAVGLFGVDESLAQLVPLPGPDEMARVRPPVTMHSPAFGVLDGTALLLGRIRGAQAQAATLLRVSQVPSPPVLDAVASVSGSSSFDAIGALTDRFYQVLATLHDRTRAWEKQAPASDRMSPSRMAEMWNQALDALARKGQPVDDAYGRRLRLHRLPPDLLALADPRAVVSIGTRLPEDVENWSAWVRRVKP